ncbi:VOC family protein [Salimicrobium halophilum]|uniref:Catechol 2,3-dioxygenase n=1 Tax=Salimicrobium halophilum TaxID=86666 RepID=A0A1G8RHF6_9BACI|nr:VOC family protein [Salimicrobium halophilum]SDJ15935.1 Catechol 2,3-dioxygenase [Salimicrobium halophilum]
MTEGLLHHVEIYVSDLEKSKAFWGWFLVELGYESFQQWDNGHSWKLGETYLVFVQTESEYLDVPYHRRRTGLNHLAFHASSRNRVDEIREMLKKWEVPMLYEKDYPYAGGEDHYAVYFEDPDRIKVEVVAPST